MAAARVILVADTHLSASAPQAQANWDAVVSYVGACAPDLVVTRAAQESMIGATGPARLCFASRLAVRAECHLDAAFVGAAQDVQLDGVAGCPERGG